METIIVRRAETRDLDDILRLNLALFEKEYQEYDSSLDIEWVYDETRGKKYFQKRVNAEGFAAVSEYEGRVVGYLCGGIHESENFRKKIRTACLENMLVEEYVRGKGLGKKLFNVFLDWCKENKIELISVTASAQNKQGIGFYRANGFQDYNLTLELKLKGND